MKLDPASIHHHITTALVCIAVIDNTPDIARPDFRYPGSRCSNIGLTRLADWCHRRQNSGGATRPSSSCSLTLTPKPARMRMTGISVAQLSCSQDTRKPEYRDYRRGLLNMGLPEPIPSSLDPSIHLSRRRTSREIDTWDDLLRHAPPPLAPPIMERYFRGLGDSHRGKPPLEDGGFQGGTTGVACFLARLLI